jgi:hypothetical protein
MLSLDYRGHALHVHDACGVTAGHVSVDVESTALQLILLKTSKDAWLQRVRSSMPNT